MFSYNPTVQNNAGEIAARNQMYAAEALANAQVQASEIEAQNRAQREQGLAQLIGTALSTGVGFATGGPVGGALALAGGAANMMGPMGQAIAPALGTFAQLYGQKESGKALDKAMGMAADEGLVTYDTLEKFTNLPWQQKAPVFDLWRSSMLPVQTNRMKVQDQARVWGEYRGGGGADPMPSAANRYGYVYQGP
jgi:hypothetical protein